MTNLIALPSGTVLAGDYTIDRVLGAGGFGVTYLAREDALSRLVTLKEYFPGDFAARANGLDACPRSEDCASDYKWGLDRFLEEAQTLAKFDHPNIVRVYRSFKANNTAYMVLQFEEGQSLKTWLKTLNRPPRQKELDRMLAPMLDALETIHKADFLHRDIAPDNIILRKSGDPVLIDFGAARSDIAAHSKTKTVSALVKPGYSPYEQYAETSKQQGPWTDIYALAATLYHLVTGKRPPDSPSRMLKDEYVPALEAARGKYRDTFLAAIDRGLALTIDGRPRSVAHWRSALLQPEPKGPGLLARIRGDVADTKKKPKTAKTSKAKTPARAATAVDKAVATVVPPPPDAPGPAGILLDFFEALRQPAAARPVKAKAAPAPEKPSADAKTPAKGATKKAAPAGPALKPSGAPQRATGKRRTWTRGLRGKLALAAALSGVVLAYPEQVQRAFLEPAGSNVVTGSVATQQPTRTLVAAGQFKAHDGAVEHLSLSGDGRLIVTASTDRTLKVWSRANLAAEGAIYMDDGPATSLSVRNNRALTTHADGSINIWDIEKRQRLYRFKRNSESVWAASFTGSEDRIAAAGHDSAVALWETSSEQAPKQLLEGHENSVQAVASDPAGSWLVSGGADKSIKLWNLETLDLKRTYRNNSDLITALAVSGDANLIASGSHDGSVRLHGMGSTRTLRTFNAHKAKVTSVVFSMNGEYLASAAEDGSVRVRGLKPARAFWTLNTLEKGAKSLAFDSEGRHLLTGGPDGVVTVWAMPEPALAQR